MQTVTVKKLNWKDGEGAKGKWSKIGILTEEIQDKWLGCFEDKYNSTRLRAITEGAVMEVVVTENGDFLNFSFPKAVDKALDELETVNKRLSRLENAVFPPTIGNTNVAYPMPEETSEPNDDDF